MSTLGLYLHIPFCVAKCHYCDFHSAAATPEAREAYVKALERQIAAWSEAARGRTVDTVYVGGGTPTVLSADALCGILGAVRGNFSLTNDAEITLECNPATGNEGALFALREAGFNRLSIGLQSVHENELARLGRPHGFYEFEKTFTAARRAGFSNISADVMFGIPEQTPKSFEETLERLLSYSPDHVSAYGLKVEEGTPFFKWRGKLALPDDDAQADMQELAAGVLGDAGFLHYEISNYARNGAISRHNMRYWRGEEYLGLGAAAHSYLNGWRFAAPRDTALFITAAARGDWQVLATERQRIAGVEARNEYIMLRMRLFEGLDTEDFKHRFGLGFEDCCGGLDRLVAAGILKKEGKRVAFTERGMYVSNAVLSDWLDFEEEE